MFRKGMLIALLLALAVLVSLAACGGAAPATPTKAPEPTKAPAPTVAPTKAPEPTKPPAPPTVAASPTPAAAYTGPNLGGKELKIGSDTAYPPFEFPDKDKKIVGFDVDMVDEICKLANCKYKFITTYIDTIFTKLAAGEFDLVVSGVTITEERKKTVDFSDSYLKYGEVILVRADETKIQGKDDIKNVMVGVQTGTSNEETAKKLVANEKTNLKRYQTFDLAVAALINKDVDAVVIDSPAADGFMAQNRGKLKKAGQPFTSDDLGIAVKKGDKQLLDAFNAGLKVIKANGTWDKLYKKWFEDFKPGS